jgi:uncharacterized protein with HEPN domain
MPKDEIVDHLDLMLQSAGLVEMRFSRVRVPEDFVTSADGVTILDSVSMRLQVIGESVRRIQKLDPSFLSRCPSIDWDKLARFRDLVSHHYTQIDHEIIFDICKVHIPQLKDALQKIRADIPTSEGSASS